MEALLIKIPFLSGFLNFPKTTREQEYNKKVIEDIRDVKMSLECVESRYNLTSDSDLVESLIYEERALKAKYAYLLRLAKTNGVIF